MIRGTTVILYERVRTGEDGFHVPIWQDEPVTVQNVLVGQPTTDEVVGATDLYGKTLSFWLGIPKGDTNDWTDRKIQWTDAYGRTVKAQTFGYPVTGIEANVPGPWHMKVRCMLCE